MNIHGMQVSDLKKYLEKVPDSTPVLYQRIEDEYFEKHGWGKGSPILRNSEDQPELYPGSKSQFIYTWFAWYDEKDEVFKIEAHY